MEYSEYEWRHRTCPHTESCKNAFSTNSIWKNRTGANRRRSELPVENSYQKNRWAWLAQKVEKIENGKNDIATEQRGCHYGCCFEVCSACIQISIALTLVFDAHRSSENVARRRQWKHPNNSREMCFGRPLLTFIGKKAQCNTHSVWLWQTDDVTEHHQQQQLQWKGNLIIFALLCRSPSVHCKIKCIQ